MQFASCLILDSEEYSVKILEQKLSTFCCPVRNDAFYNLSAKGGN